MEAEGVAAAAVEVVVVAEGAVVEAADAEAEAASNRPNLLSQGLRLPARKPRRLAVVVAVVSGAADAAREFLQASTP